MGTWPRGAWPAAVLAVGLLSACDPADVDPTDPGNFSSVVFVNDTRSPAVLFECGDTHGRGCHDMSGRLAPGERSGQRVYWGAGAADPWEVRDTHGHVVGWLLVDSPHRETGVVYRLSDAEPRPGRVTAPYRVHEKAGPRDPSRGNRPSP